MPDKFTVNTTPKPDGGGVRLFSEEYSRGENTSAQMPETFDHAGLNHSQDPGAESSAGVESTDGTFKGCKSNPGLRRY